MIRRHLTTPFIASLLLLGTGETASASPVALSFIEEQTPDMAPALLSKDGARYLVFHRYKKLACDPEDQYGEGICDWRVTATMHTLATGKKVSSFDFIWGKWKKKTDKAALAKKLADFEEPARAKQNSEGRRYAFASYRLVIDGHKRAVRVRILDKASGKERFSKKLEKKYRCRAKGKRTIWGAEIYWYAAHEIALINNPRACKKRFVVVAPLK